MLEIPPLGSWQEDYLSTPDLILIEAAIAPRSLFAGQTLPEIHFEQKFDAKVLAIWREGRSIRTRLANLPLQFGDGLLLHGSKKSLDLLRTEPGLILIAEPVQPGSCISNPHCRDHAHWRDRHDLDRGPNHG